MSKCFKHLTSFLRYSFFATLVLLGSSIACEQNGVSPNSANSVTPPDREIEIPMRDGVKLPANVYLPARKNKEKVPCVLVRQPLGKNQVDPSWLQLTKSGYAVVIQSTRSCIDETGKAIPYLTDGWGDDRKPADGYDTVQWIAAADFCDGTVSTVGVSATGITQFLLAPASPPNLRCQFIELAAPSLYQYVVFPGGQFRKEQVEAWLQVHKRHPSVLDWLKSKSKYDSFWSRFNAIDYADQVRVPQFMIGGWYDIFLQGTIDAFIAVREHSQSEVRGKHRLVIGPWGHLWRYTGKIGDFVLEKNQLAPPLNITPAMWFDYHLKGTKNGVEKAPTVQYYVMGPFNGTPSKGNKWRSADTWPPLGAEYQHFFLGPQKLLSKESDSKSLAVTFDSKDPVPTIGGRNLYMPDGPRDLKSLITRPDVFSFYTDELPEDFEVTGRLWANLYIADVEKERDVCLRLVDVYPTGEQYLVAEGVSHIAPKQSTDRSQDPRLVIVDLWSTSMVFAKGHKIGLLVTASNYPSYDLGFDPNEEKGTAFTIHASKKFPSALALPVMKDQETKAPFIADAATGAEK